MAQRHRTTEMDGPLAPLQQARQQRQQQLQEQERLELDWMVRHQRMLAKVIKQMQPDKQHAAAIAAAVLGTNAKVRIAKEVRAHAHVAHACLLDCF